MLVVFLFLRRAAPTIAAGVTVPLSLAGTCAAMWLRRLLDRQSVADGAAVSVGFVVDDAIVMIENVFRNLEKGHSPLRAAIEGARQIGFTVISISVSLIAAFIPLLFMGGIVGRLFREFSVTLAFAIAISTVVSLTVTPMICAHFMRSDAEPEPRGASTARSKACLDALIRVYAAALSLALRASRADARSSWRRPIGAHGRPLHQDAEGLLPAGRHRPGLRLDPRLARHLVRGDGRAAAAQAHRHRRSRIRPWPASAPRSAAPACTGSVNRGRLFVSLKPLAERDGLTTARVIDRLRPRFGQLPGIQRLHVPGAGRARRRPPERLAISVHAVELRSRRAAEPGCRGSVDRIKHGAGRGRRLDRPRAGRAAAQRRRSTGAAASRLGVRIQDIDAALNNAFAQRQISTIYTQRNQYRVILEVDPQFQRDPDDLTQIYRRRLGGTQVPLSAVARFERGLAPLVVNHQGQFPVGHDLLRPAAGRTRSRPRRRTCAGGRRHASARHHPRRVRRRRAARSPEVGRRAAAADRSRR